MHDRLTPDIQHLPLSLQTTDHQQTLEDTKKTFTYITLPMSFPLEEKYFGFEFSADYTHAQHLGEGSALAIFQVINGKLEEKYNPCDNGFEIGEENTEEAIAYLKEEGAKELFSTLRGVIPSHNEELLGITIGFDASEEYEDDKTRYEYRGLCDDENKEREDILKEHGIELKQYIKK